MKICRLALKFTILTDFFGPGGANFFVLGHGGVKGEGEGGGPREGTEEDGSKERNCDFEKKRK